MGWLEDTFTDSQGTLLENHTPDVGGTWVQEVGSLEMDDSNQLHEPDNSGSQYYNDADSPNGEDELTIDIVSADDAGFWRWRGFLNYDPVAETGYRFSFVKAESRFQIHRLDGSGDLTLLDESSQVATDPPTTFKVRKSGETLEFLKDDSVRASAADNDYTSGNAGVHLKALHVDNLDVTDIATVGASIDTAPDVLVRTGSGYSITGSAFGPSQGTGDLTLETADGTTTVESQSITNWEDNQIDFDLVIGAHTIGDDDLQLKVTTDDGETATHTDVTLRHPQAIRVCKDDADAAIASESIDWWMRSDRSNAPDDSGTDSTDASGNLEMTLPNTSAAPGDMVTVDAKRSNGETAIDEVAVS